jgi:hypothetical protein
MGISARTVTREIGTALAVLAIYVLTLLLPLHQAAAQQRDLEALGYSTLESWSVCQPLAEDEQGDPKQDALVKCPAAGISKNPVGLSAPPAIPVALDLLSEPSHYPPTIAATPLSPPDHVGQSRAPPVLA